MNKEMRKLWWEQLETSKSQLDRYDIELVQGDGSHTAVVFCTTVNPFMLC